MQPPFGEFCYIHSTMQLHYFAYGSNLHPARLRARVPSAEVVEVAVLPDRALRFCKRSEDGSAKCTLVPELGSRAFGVVYRIDEADKPLLDCIEGLGQGYDEAWQWLPLNDGVVRVFHYVATADYIDRSLQPYHWYKNLVLAGARNHGFPGPYLGAIEKVPSIEDPDPSRRAKNAAILAQCRDSLEEEVGDPASTERGKPDTAHGNLLNGVPADLQQELFETLAHSDAVHIERIVSRGHTSPAEGWYDQPRNEWVLLLQGAARIAFADGDEVTMKPGDWLRIPARCKHRVAWTDPEQASVWLAVHYA